MQHNNINLIPDRSGPGSTTAVLPSGASRGGSNKCATGSQNTSRMSLIIGTWNVRTLKQSGKVELLVNEMDRVNWNILGISEMRWKGIG